MPNGKADSRSSADAPPESSSSLTRCLTVEMAHVPPYTADVTVEAHRAGTWLSPSQAVYLTVECQAQTECATQ